MASLQKILSYAIKHGASDVHLATNNPPAVRIDGVIRFIRDADDLTSEDLDSFISELMGEERKKRFLETGDADLSYNVPGMGRFRVNCLKQRGAYGIVMRYVKSKIPSLEELHLPDESMDAIARSPRGLVLVTGTTGSGKSTTIASLIDIINENRRCHIVTLEDPIEYLHTNKRSIVTQRELSIDTRDWDVALRAVMREDPDVILIGEMRDAETFQACISASETGHLVFSTLHTTNAMMTIDRILDLFPSTQQEQIRSQLALQLRACVAQRLLPSADGEGRVPAVEVLFNSPAIAELIREDNIRQIPNVIAGGANEGMQTFNMSLEKLVKAHLVTEEDAYLASDNPEELKMNLQGIRLSQGRGGITKR
jgi:twitching motility protein PilT